MNNRISAKERGLIKGAIRRVFSRSDLRRAVIASVRVPGHHDVSRPRVKKWSKCGKCGRLTPEYLMECDHISPIVPIDKTLEEMSWDTVIDRTWCLQNNLQAICKDCHSVKTKEEREARKAFKKGKLK